MDNRELIKELLTLSDEALTKLGYRGMTGDARKVAKLYAEGCQIECKERNYGTWIEARTPSFQNEEYRIKRKAVTVNGVEVPAPETEPPEGVYYIADPTSESYAARCKWEADEFDLRLLARGLVHLDKESAVAHAKSMCMREASE